MQFIQRQGDSFFSWEKTRRNNRRTFFYRGSDIVLSENNTVAHRTSSESAEVYSNIPLYPGELFLIEIEEVQRFGCIGHMRIGLTRRDPHSYYFKDEKYGDSYSNILRTDWTVGVSKLNIYDALRNFRRLYNEKPSKNLEQTEQSLITCRGIIPRYQLQPNSVVQNVDLDGCEVGSRIGVMFIPTSDREADLHVIVNGKDEGPLIPHIPFSVCAPLYVVIELMGSTRKIRTVHLSFDAPSLKLTSKEFLMDRLPPGKVKLLPIPNELKKFLLT